MEWPVERVWMPEFESGVEGRSGEVADGIVGNQKLYTRKM